MSALATFSTAMSVYDPELKGHASRVAGHAEAIATRLGWDDERLDQLRVGAALHDIGKLNVRPAVLAKPGRLDEAELAEIRTHPVEGAWLIAGVPSLASALPYVLFHHERWDGLGYPTRRAATEIPIEGRILALADAFDAMTSPRAYRTACAPDDALGEVRRCAGTQFDPELAEALEDAVTSCTVVNPAST
ncbi:MAG: HD-GYP domain-containing protein [Gaiella sp.]